MLKNLKIGMRLFICFIIIVLVLSFAGVIGIVLLNTTNAEYSNALINYGFAQGEFAKIAETFQQQRASTLNLLGANTDALKKTHADSLTTLDTKLDEVLKTSEAYLQSDEDKQTFEKLKTLYAEYKTKRDDVINSSANKTPEENIAFLSQNCSEIVNSFTTSIDNLLENVTVTGTKLSADLDKQTLFFTIIMIIIIIVGVIISIILALISTLSITKPVKEIGFAIDSLSNGKLSIDINYKSKDEIGEMAGRLKEATSTIKTYIDDIDTVTSLMAGGNFVLPEPTKPFIGDFEKIVVSFLAMSDSISNALNQINISANQVSTGADQVSAASSALAQGATEQASAIEELSATITEVSNQVKDNANNATKAQDLSDVSSQAVIKSNEQMNRMVNAMNEINDKSNQISKIVKTIEDIAFKTDILALNAAVEAAKAGGTAGKGFAVVASEVRSLSSQSAEAAKNTTALIKASIEAVENGTEIANVTAKNLMEVVDSVSSTSKIINEINSATSEQAQALSQITISINQISSVVQTNSATSEESAATSEEMFSQANMLKSLIAQFKLNVNAKNSGFNLNIQNNSNDNFSSYSDSFGSDNSKY